MKNKILWIAAAAVIVLLAVSGDPLRPLADPQRDAAVGAVAPTHQGAAFRRLAAGDRTGRRQGEDRALRRALVPALPA